MVDVLLYGGMVTVAGIGQWWITKTRQVRELSLAELQTCRVGYQHNAEQLTKWLICIAETILKYYLQFKHWSINTFSSMFLKTFDNFFKDMFSNGHLFGDIISCTLKNDEANNCLWIFYHYGMYTLRSWCVSYAIQGSLLSLMLYIYKDIICYWIVWIQSVYILWSSEYF
jgi:hypothetical protein